MTAPDTDDHPPASPAESLRLIAEERATATRELIPDIRLLSWPWGIAWLVGFGLLFLRFGPNDRVFVSMPVWLPLTVLYTLLAINAAGVIIGPGWHSLIVATGGGGAMIVVGTIGWWHANRRRA